jgi:nitroreductase
MKSLEEILLPLFAANRKFYGTACQIVVCAGIVPDPLQTLEPVASPSAPAPVACIRRRIKSMKRSLSILVVAIMVGNLLAQSVDLPAPQKSGGMPLMDALAKRSTARAFDSKALSPQQLSSLLWAAFGINRPDGKRTAPSARDFQETDIYVLMKQGAYVYSARSNKLDLVVAEDIRALGGTQAFVKDAPATLVFVADLSKMGNGSNEDKKNTANIDVGYISQNVYLFCASEGLVTGARGMVDRTALGPRLKLRPDQMIILAQSVGYPKP